MWYLKHKQTQERFARNFPTREAAEGHLDRLGPVVKNQYMVEAVTGNPRADRMLTEGLVKGDLYKILLPRISVDEFVPGDPETDNVVIAFFLKGVPEATIPYKSFVEKSNGVISADYGDSETVVGAQNVYAEFDRENLEIEDIHGLLIQAAMLAGFETDDFTMTFPHTDDKFPYDPVTMKEYFISRDIKKNQMAQQKALDRAAQEFEQTMADAQAEVDQANAEAEQPAPEGGDAMPEPENTGQGLGGAPEAATGASSIEQELGGGGPQNTGQGLPESLADRWARLPLTG